MGTGVVLLVAVSRVSASGHMVAVIMVVALVAVSL
jgi:hypothetical protein